MKTTSLTSVIANYGESNWCVLCASVVLLGNCWTVVIGAPAELMYGYACISSAFALATMASLPVRKMLR